MYLVNRQGYFRREVNKMDKSENHQQVVDLLAEIIINYLYEQQEAEEVVMDSDEAA